MIRKVILLISFLSNNYFIVKSHIFIKFYKLLMAGKGKAGKLSIKRAQNKKIERTITRGGIRRLARRGGVKRISDGVYT